MKEIMATGEAQGMTKRKAKSESIIPDR